MTTRMQFGEALGLLWQGKSVAREKWKDMYLRLRRDRDILDLAQSPLIFLETECDVLGVYSCPQYDILADDWVVVQ